MEDKLGFALSCVVIAIAIGIGTNFMMAKANKEEAYERGYYAGQHECYEEIYSEGYDEGFEDGRYQGYLDCLRDNDIIE